MNNRNDLNIHKISIFPYQIYICTYYASLKKFFIINYSYDNLIISFKFTKEKRINIKHDMTAWYIFL